MVGVQTSKVRFGIADTMFARGDMGAIIERVFRDSGRPIEAVRYTVPGIKDLGVACRKLFYDYGCDIVVAAGMVGLKPVDEQCGHEATMGIQMVQAAAGRHVLEVFVHENEADGDDAKLAAIMADRASKHAQNAVDLMFGRDSLTARAGTGQRQGGPNANPVKLG